MDINIDHKIAVALRRIIMENIPHYSFDNIIINSNDTLLNNDHIKKRINTIPVENIYIDLKKLEKINDEDLFNNDIKDSNNQFDVLKIICSKKYDINNKNLLQSVSTNDCIFYLNEKKIKNPMKYNIKIVDFKYNTDSIDFIASTNIGIPMQNINYSISETVILIPTKKGNKLTIFPKSESITSKIILQNAIYILKKKMDFFLKQLKNISDKKGKICICNDVFTLGYLYSYLLNKEKEISFCSINIDTLIKKKSYLNFILKQNSKINIYDLIKNINSKVFKELSTIKI